jgi:nucleoside diphosphate kinase
MVIKEDVTTNIHASSAETFFKDTEIFIDRAPLIATSRSQSKMLVSSHHGLAESTVVIIKPGAFEKADEIKKILQNNYVFSIESWKEILLTPADVEYLYRDHVSKPFFENIVNVLTGGKSMVLLLGRENACNVFRQIVGPIDPESARETAPTSLRALFGTDIINNGFYSSDGIVRTTQDEHHFFPDGSEIPKYGEETKQT